MLCTSRTYLVVYTMATVDLNEYSALFEEVLQRRGPKLQERQHSGVGA